MELPGGGTPPGGGPYLADPAGPGERAAGADGTLRGGPARESASRGTSRHRADRRRDARAVGGPGGLPGTLELDGPVPATGRRRGARGDGGTGGDGRPDPRP